MPQLRLPDYYHVGIKHLIQLSQDQVTGLISTLQAEQPIYYHPRQLADGIAPKVNIDRQALWPIIHALVGLYTVRAVTGLSIEDFAEAIAVAVEEKGLQPLAPESRARLKANLVPLLSLDGALGVASKALSVVADQNRIFIHARVLSDLRAVFKEDPEVSPSAMAIVHTLMIRYHESGDLKSFFVALDDEDVRKLRGALERAQKKSTTLKSVAKSANIPIIRIEGESGT
jgi:hypothetical protein